MTANSVLLQQVLKADWGFTGVVISDWSATTTTVPSALAGLDLVMPGPDGPWGDKLVAAVRKGAVPEAQIDDKVSRIFALARRLGGFNGSKPAVKPELIDPALLRKATASSFVLLSNAGGLLPLKQPDLKRVALIGPNALVPQTQGGGSIQVLPAVRVHLAESLRRAPSPRRGRSGADARDRQRVSAGGDDKPLSRRSHGDVFASSGAARAHPARSGPRDRRASGLPAREAIRDAAARHLADARRRAVDRRGSTCGERIGRRGGRGWLG